VFSHRINAKRHLKRELQGLSKLAARGLSSPAVLFSGKTEDSRWAIVTEKIPDSSTVLDVLDKTTDSSKKLDLLLLVCKELAKQHNKGVLQKDLHPGNFLLSGDKIFVLDPGQMRFCSRPVAKKKSVSQLALLVHVLPANDTESVTKLFEQYFKARSWRLDESDKVLFQKQLTAQRKKGVKNGLKKCLRTSKRHLRIKAGRYVGVLDRDFTQGAEPLDFIEQIDALMDKGQILKNGRACYVSHLTWNDRDIVVKRYNHKGFIHSLRHTIKNSRARRGWLHAHRLRMLNIATPKPLAYIEQCKGLLVWKSYLVTEYVEGQKLYDFLRDGNTSEEQRSKIRGQVMELIKRLEKHRITHGDLKHSNILITDLGPVLTDLDGMKVHKCDGMHRYRFKKDIKRFWKTE